MTLLEADQVPATSLILAGEAWMAKADATLGAAETRLSTQLAARRELRSRLAHLERLSSGLASDADTLIAFAATKGLVAGRDGVDLQYCNQMGDGARSAPVHIPDVGDGTRSAPVLIPDDDESSDD